MIRTLPPTILPRMALAGVRRLHTRSPIIEDFMKFYRSHTADASTESVTDSTAELQPRRMRDSYCESHLPFRTDHRLREHYINAFGALRLGKIMEDLDVLAAMAAYKHCWAARPARPLTIVTASVDRMDLLNMLRPDLDMRASGHVTYVGRSSMEVTLRMESQGDPKTGQVTPDWTPIGLAKFTMVARNAAKEAAHVPQLVLETEQEQRLFDRGMRHKQLQVQSAQRDLTREPPTPAERLLIHQLWLEQRQFEDSRGRLTNLQPLKDVLMEDTLLHTVKICHPQERNIHGSIFGGFLMREAFELAYANAASFLRARPYAVALDHVAFRRPVPVGTFLHLTSQVVYAEGEPHKTFQVSVVAEIEDVASGERSLSNTFNFTFSCDPTVWDMNAEIKRTVRRVVPRTYGEAMKMLLGRRRKEHALSYRSEQLHEFLNFQPQWKHQQ